MNGLLLLRFVLLYHLLSSAAAAATQSDNVTAVQQKNIIIYHSLYQQVDNEKNKLKNQNVIEISNEITIIHQMMQNIIGNNDMLRVTCKNEYLWTQLLEIMFVCEKFQANIMKRITFLTRGDGLQISSSSSASSFASASSSVEEEEVVVVEEEMVMDQRKRSIAAQEEFRIQLNIFMMMLDNVEEFARCGKIENKMKNEKKQRNEKKCFKKFMCSTYDDDDDDDDGEDENNTTL